MAWTALCGRACASGVPSPGGPRQRAPQRIRGLGHRRLHVSASLLFRDSQGSAKLRSEGAENRSCRLRRAASRVTGPVVANALSRHQSVTKTHEPGSPGWGCLCAPNGGLAVARARARGVVCLRTHEQAADGRFIPPAFGFCLSSLDSAVTPCLPPRPLAPPVEGTVAAPAQPGSVSPFHGKEENDAHPSNRRRVKTKRLADAQPDRPGRSRRTAGDPSGAETRVWGRRAGTRESDAALSHLRWPRVPPSWPRAAGASPPGSAQLLGAVATLRAPRRPWPPHARRHRPRGFGVCDASRAAEPRRRSVPGARAGGGLCSAVPPGARFPERPFTRRPGRHAALAAAPWVPSRPCLGRAVAGHTSLPGVCCLPGACL